MASAKQSKKMRILLIPFFATSHIGPYTNFAVRLAAARPGSVEPFIAVTPANVPVVRSTLEGHGPAASGMIKIVTYPFPCVDGLPPGVENLSTAGDDAWRIDAAAVDESLLRPAQEALLRDKQLSLDAVVTDHHFFWNSSIAAELGLERVWSGARSTRYEEKELVPADAVARAVERFLEAGGPWEAARGRARDLAVKANAAVAEGGSSSCDLHRLIDDLIEARAAAASAAPSSSSSVASSMETISNYG